jgi:hypothetical protein
MPTDRGPMPKLREPSYSARGHLLERGVEDGNPVLRCRRPGCDLVWLPDQTMPSFQCRRGGESSPAERSN